MTLSFFNSARKVEVSWPAK